MWKPPIWRKETFDLAEKLLAMDDETFTLAKEIFVNSTIKFYKGPVVDHTFNINIIQELNTAQLKFFYDLIETEFEKRDKEKREDMNNAKEKI